MASQEITNCLSFIFKHLLDTIANCMEMHLADIRLILHFIVHRHLHKSPLCPVILLPFSNVITGHGGATHEVCLFLQELFCI